MVAPARPDAKMGADHQRRRGHGMNDAGPSVGERRVRAAVVQAAPAAFDLEATLDRVATLVANATAEGAELVVLPEAFVGGYPKGADFGARVGSRSPEGREWFRRYHAGAIDVPGPGTDRLGAIARANRTLLVVGAIERDRGTLYCTALFIGPDGGLLGKHRKVMPTAMERLIWGFGDGSTLPVLGTRLGRVGAVICWENYMPQLRLAMYGQGVELYCAPTVDDRETWLPTMRHIAMEGRCFVLSANQFARRSDYPADYPVGTGDPEEVLIAGGSCIVDPFGRVLAGPARDGEAILVADLDLAEIARGRYDLDVVGHYGRPDIFELIVDRRARHPVADAPAAGSVASADDPAG
jgi:nitrilase